MILKITEYCAWENERWSYIIDLSKQEAAAINSLMIFMRCANDYYKIAEAQAQSQPSALPFHPLFNRHPRNPFAASRYSFDFFDSADEGNMRLSCAGRTVSLSDGCGYHFSTNFMLNRKISLARIKSAMVAMRDKNQNKLYKSFDSVFLAPKRKSQPA